MMEERILNVQSSGGRMGCVVEGDTLQLLFEIHAIAIFKGFNWQSWSFVIPRRCRRSHNLISLEGEMMSKLMREELWTDWVDPIIGIAAEVRRTLRR